MNPPEWLAGYLEQGVHMPGTDAPDAAMANAANTARKDGNPASSGQVVLTSHP